MNGATAFFDSLYVSNDRFLWNSWPLKIRLLQCYVVLWILWISSINRLAIPKYKYIANNHKDIHKQFGLYFDHDLKEFSQKNIKVKRNIQPKYLKLSWKQIHTFFENLNNPKDIHNQFGHYFDHDLKGFLLLLLIQKCIKVKTVGPNWLHKIFHSQQGVVTSLRRLAHWRENVIYDSFVKLSGSYCDILRSLLAIICAINNVSS